MAELPLPGQPDPNSANPAPPRASTADAAPGTGPSPAAGPARISAPTPEVGAADQAVPGAGSGHFPADGTGARKRVRRRRKHRSRWLLRTALVLAVITGAAGAGLGGWWLVTRMNAAERVLDVINVPGQAPGRTLRDGDVLDVPVDGRLTMGRPDLTATLIGGTRATVVHGAHGLDLTLSGDANVTVEAALTAPGRLRVVSGEIAAEITAGHLRLRRRGDSIAVAALLGPVQLSRSDSGTTAIAPGTWVEIGADGRFHAPHPAALRAGMIGWWPGDEGGGSVLHERSGAGAPWPLAVAGATWGAGGLSAVAGGRAATAGGESAIIANAPVPPTVTTALLSNTCSFEVWCSRPGAPTTDLTVLAVADSTGVELRIRLPPLPLGDGEHHLVVTYGLDRHQVTWVDGRIHADVLAPIQPNDLRPPLTLLVTGATTLRACAVFGTTLAKADIADLFHAGTGAP